MDHNTTTKVWDLASRERRVSKGQAKIYLTRNAGEKHQLNKLTHQLEREKAATASQLSYAQRLLLKRYGGGGSRNVEAEKRGDLRNVSRDRSSSCAPTFITRAHDEIRYKSDPGHLGSAYTGRSRSKSHDYPSGPSRSRDNTGLSHDSVEELHVRLAVPTPARFAADIPRVYSLGNLTTEIENMNTLANTRKFSSVENLSRTRSSSFRSQGEISDGSQELALSEELMNRNRSLSDVLPPISLPPIYRQEEGRLTGKTCPGVTGQTSLTGNVHNNGVFITGLETSRGGCTGVTSMPGTTRKTGFTGSSAVVGSRKVSEHSPQPGRRRQKERTLTIDDTLSECRYLRSAPSKQ